MNRAFIGLGSNIEPRETYLQKALQSIANNEQTKLVTTSSIYETAPVGYKHQNNFLNMVVEVETTFSSIELLRFCQAVENEFGRKRTIKNGPRTLDLDILVYNNENRSLEDLTIPHPRLHERAFVLVPFHEIAPELTLPNLGLKIKDLLNELPAHDLQGVVKWKECNESFIL